MVSRGELLVACSTGSRSLPGNRRLPVALLQLNLKLPPAVLADWRAQAAAQGLSVRDWLVSSTAQAAAPAAPAAPGLICPICPNGWGSLERELALLRRAPSPERVA